jgi:hypothetical protein
MVDVVFMKNGSGFVMEIEGKESEGMGDLETSPNT